MHVVRGLSQVSEKKGNRKTATEPPLSLSICFLLLSCLSVPRFSYSLFKRRLRSLGFSPKSPGKDSSQPVPIGCSGWDYEVPQAALIPGPRDADIWPRLCLPGWHMVQGWRWGHWVGLGLPEAAPVIRIKMHMIELMPYPRKHP